MAHLLQLADTRGWFWAVQPSCLLCTASLLMPLAAAPAHSPVQTGPSYYDDNVGRGTLTRLVLDTKVGWGWEGRRRLAAGGELRRAGGLRLEVN